MTDLELFDAARKAGLSPVRAARYVRKEDPNAYREHQVADDTLAALQAQADNAGQLIPGGASHE